MDIHRLSGVLVAVVGLAVAGLIFAGCQAPGSVLRGKISTSAGTHVAGVVVAVYSNVTDEVVAQTTTDGDGDYSFLPTALRDGTYRILFASTDWWQNATKWTDATPVRATVAAPAVIDATVAVATGSVSGTVTNTTTSTPAAGVKVAAISTISGSTIATTTTASTGMYGFGALPAGSYVFEFTGTGLTTRYNSSAFTKAAAPVIAIAGGSVTTGIDTTVAANATITGTVTNGTTGVSGILVVAYDPATGQVLAHTVSTSDGTFTITGLNNAPYTVGFGDFTGHFQTLIYGSTSTDPTTGTTVTPTGGTISIGTIALTPVTPAGWQFLTPPQDSVNWLATAVNDSGLVVGETDSGQAMACSGSCTTPILLVTPAGYQARVTGVSSSGEIVGYGVNISNSTQEALVWSSTSATPTVLTSPSVGNSSVTVTGVSSGEIVGQVSGSTMVWSSPSAAPTALSATGYSSVSVDVVTSSGELLGSGTNDSTGNSDVLVWSSVATTPTALSTIGYRNVTVATASSSGEVVGSGTNDSTGNSDGLVWSSVAATPTVLAPPAGYSGVNVNGVTSTGEIVGYGTNTSTNTADGLVWSSSTATTPTALTVTGYHNVFTKAVSSSGEIVGGAFDNSTNLATGIVWSSASAVPVALLQHNLVTVSGVSSSGEIFGNLSNSAGRNSVGLVWSSASATPTALASGTDGFTDVNVAGVSPSGEIVGVAFNDATGGSEGLVWSSVSATPSVLAAPTGVSTDNIAVAGVTSSGEIVGYVPSGSGEGLVWSSPSATPSPLASPTGYRVAGVRAVSPSGEIVGDATNGSGFYGVEWSSSMAVPVVLASPAGGYNTVLVTGVGSSGEILGIGTTDSSGANEEGLVWSSASAVPTLLATLAGSSHVSPAGVSSSGEIVGIGTNSSNGDISASDAVVLVWSSVSAVPTVLTAPDGYRVANVTGVTASGSIFGTATDSNGQDVGYVSTP